MSFIEGLPIMPNGSKAILQVMPIDIMYIIFDELALSDGSLDIKTLLLVLPYVSRHIAEKAHRYTKSHWNLC